MYQKSITAVVIAILIANISGCGNKPAPVTAPDSADRAGKEIVYLNSQAELLRTSGRPDEAMQFLNRALQMNPSNAMTHNNLGCALRDKGQLDEAAVEFERAIELEPGFVLAHNNYGVVLAEQKRFAEAIKSFGEALTIDPNFPGALENLWQAGLSEGKMNDVLKVLLNLEQTGPVNAEIYYRAGLSCEMQQQADEAIKQLETAVKLDSNHVAARGALGRIFLQKGRYRESAAQYDVAVRLDPTNAETLFSYTMLLTNAPDPGMKYPELATALAEEACRLTDYNQPDLLDILSRVYAIQEEWPLAINAARRAIDAAKKTGQNKLAGQIQERLDSYLQAMETDKKRL